MTSGLENSAAFLRKCLPLCIIHFKFNFLMQRRTVLSDNDFPKYFQAHVAMSIMVAWRFLKQYLLRARWSHIFNSGFRPWPLRTEISPDSLNLFTILWTVDGETPKFFAILFTLQSVLRITFSVLFCLYPNFFECVPGITFCCFLYLQNTIRFVSENTENVFSELLSVQVI